MRNKMIIGLSLFLLVAQSNAQENTTHDVSEDLITTATTEIPKSCKFQMLLDSSSRAQVLQGNQVLLDSIKHEDVLDGLAQLIEVGQCAENLNEECQVEMDKGVYSSFITIRRSGQVIYKGQNYIKATDTLESLVKLGQCKVPVQKHACVFQGATASTLSALYRDNKLVVSAETSVVLSIATRLKKLGYCN